MTMAVCSFFESVDGGKNCLIGEPINSCGDACPAYLADADRQPCEVWSRVMGYHRPTSAFNAGKRQEHEDRLFFAESKSSR